MNTMTAREVMMTRKAVETQMGAAILKGCKAEVEVTLRGSAGDKVELTISGTKAAVTKALAYVTAAPLSWVLSGTSDDDEDDFTCAYLRA